MKSTPLLDRQSPCPVGPSHGDEATRAVVAGKVSNKGSAGRVFGNLFTEGGSSPSTGDKSNLCRRESYSRGVTFEENTCLQSINNLPGTIPNSSSNGIILNRTSSHNQNHKFRESLQRNDTDPSKGNGTGLFLLQNMDSSINFRANRVAVNATILSSNGTLTHLGKMQPRDTLQKWMRIKKSYQRRESVTSSRERASKNGSMCAWRAIKLLTDLTQHDFFIQSDENFEYLSIRTDFARCLIEKDVVLFLHSNSPVFMKFLEETSEIMRQGLWGSGDLCGNIHDLLESSSPDHFVQSTRTGTQETDNTSVSGITGEPRSRVLFQNARHSFGESPTFGEVCPSPTSSNGPTNASMNANGVGIDSDNINQVNCLRGGSGAGLPRSRSSGIQQDAEQAGDDHVARRNDAHERTDSIAERFMVFIFEAVLCATMKMHRLRFDFLHPIVFQHLQDIVGDASINEDSILRLYPLKSCVLCFKEKLAPIMSQLDRLQDVHFLLHSNRENEYTATVPVTGSGSIPRRNSVTADPARGFLTSPTIPSSNSFSTSLAATHGSSKRYVLSSPNGHISNPLWGNNPLNRDLRDSTRDSRHEDCDDAMIPMEDSTHSLIHQIDSLARFYAMDVKELHSDLEELGRNIDETNKFLEASMDARRNQFLKMEVTLEVVGVVFAYGALVSGIFGMNLKSGVEEVDGLFYLVILSIMLVGIVIAAVAARYYYKNKRNRVYNKIFKKFGGNFHSCGRILEDDFLMDLVIQKNEELAGVNRSVSPYSEYVDENHFDEHAGNHDVVNQPVETKFDDVDRVVSSTYFDSRSSGGNSIMCDYRNSVVHSDIVERNAKRFRRSSSMVSSTMNSGDTTTIHSGTIRSSGTTISSSDASSSLRSRSGVDVFTRVRDLDRSDSPEVDIFDGAHRDMMRMMIRRKRSSDSVLLNSRRKSARMMVEL